MEEGIELVHLVLVYQPAYIMPAAASWNRQALEYEPESLDCDLTVWRSPIARRLYNRQM